jgi:hypothetical protein
LSRYWVHVGTQVIVGNDILLESRNFEICVKDSENYHLLVQVVADVVCCPLLSEIAAEICYNMHQGGLLSGEESPYRRD